MLVLIRYEYETFERHSTELAASSVMVNVDEPTGIYPAFVDHCRQQGHREARMIEYLPRCNSTTWKPEIKQESYHLPPIYGANKFI